MRNANDMSAQVNEATGKSSETSKALADLEQRLAEWSRLDWVALNPTGSESAGIRQAVTDLNRAVETVREACNRRKSSMDERVASGPSSFAGATILLAEDNTVNRMVAEGMLSQFQCRIDMVENGEEAVRQFQETEYDLVFMDCQMPVMDGFEAVARIREVEAQRRGNTQRTPIVALTANALKGDRDRCISAGMDDYISKPFSVSDLEGALDRQLGVSRTSQIRALRAREVEDTATRVKVSLDEGPFVDNDVLEAIRKLTKTDGARLLVRIIDVFLDSSPRLVDDLYNALHERDTRAVATAAHALRSSCGSVGALRLAALSKSMETQSGQGSIVEFDEWMQQLRHCHSQTLQELAAYRDTEAPSC